MKSKAYLDYAKLKRTSNTAQSIGGTAKPTATSARRNAQSIAGRTSTPTATKTASLSGTKTKKTASKVTSSPTVKKTSASRNFAARGTANPAITKKTMGASKSPVAKNSIKPGVNRTKTKTGASKSSAKRYIDC